MLIEEIRVVETTQLWHNNRNNRRRDKFQGVLETIFLVANSVFWWGENGIVADVRRRDFFVASRWRSWRVCATGAWCRDGEAGGAFGYFAERNAAPARHLRHSVPIYNYRCILQESRTTYSPWNPRETLRV